MHARYHYTPEMTFMSCDLFSTELTLNELYPVS